VEGSGPGLIEVLRTEHTYCSLTFCIKHVTMTCRFIMFIFYYQNFISPGENVSDCILWLTGTHKLTLSLFNQARAQPQMTLQI
jgi:hypothetical protein